jgi:hypothetical protein
MESGILKGMQEKLALYEELKQTAKEQFECIEAVDMDGFDAASNRRNRVQKRISALEERMARTRGQAPDQGMDPGVREIRDRIRALALEIQETDRTSSAQAEEVRGRTAYVLDQLKKGQKGVHGYAARAPRSPKFVDRQG